MNVIGVNDLNTISQFVDKFGFSLFFTTVAVYIMYRNLTTANVKLGEAQERMNSDLRSQIKELRQESRADKKMFQETVREFSRSIDEFGAVRSEIREIKQDIKELKEQK